jgi:antitoxin ParD1/3/4
MASRTTTVRKASSKTPAKTSKTTSFSLGEHFTSFVQSQVSAGRFGSASEVVREGLRMLEERESKLAALREALEAGEKSGFRKFSLERIFSRIDQESR